MAFGDNLKKKLHNGDFLNCENKKSSPKSLWITLRDTACEDLKSASPQKIDSDVATRIYYNILKDNEEYLPDWACKELSSNGQPKYRVANRNVFSSNAFHQRGLANQPGISAVSMKNTERKGNKIVFQWKGTDN